MPTEKDVFKYDAHMTTLVDVPTGEGAIHEETVVAVDFDPVTNIGDVVIVRGEDGVVTFKCGHILEYFDPEIAVKIGDALIRAAHSQTES